MKIYLETSSVENLPFSQFESEAKNTRKLDWSDLPPTGKNSTMTRKL
ncbi:hypothetical protein [Okeania sp. SIO2B3]|nr:hypothetical protein [Okeania sp. SIO2B3]NET44952.1 hypothetical protein [Okeania sp. SIO2B3]